MVNPRAKGSRNERKTMKVYERAGYWCHKPEARSHAGQSNQDMWNLFDIAAFHVHVPEIRFVQVKSNGADGVRTWCQQAKYFARVPGVQCDFVSRYDNEGYRMIKPVLADTQAYTTVFDSRGSDSNMGDDLEAFLRGDDDG